MFNDTAPSFVTDAEMAKRLDAQKRRRGRVGFLTAADAESPRIAPPRVRTAGEVIELRESLRFDRKQFADVLGVHPDTVKKYESSSSRSRRTPSPMCSRLMDLLEWNPKLVTTCGRVEYFTGEAIQRLRMEKFKMSQTIFAGLLAATTDALRAWEQNVNHPCGPAARLLQIALDEGDCIAPRLSSAA
jgi:DNA-binding transcriptional regulator YiaG